MKISIEEYKNIWNKIRGSSVLGDVYRSDWDDLSPELTEEAAAFIDKLFADEEMPFRHKQAFKDWSDLADVLTIAVQDNVEFSIPVNKTTVHFVPLTEGEIFTKKVEGIVVKFEFNKQGFITSRQYKAKPLGGTSTNFFNDVFDAVDDYTIDQIHYQLPKDLPFDFGMKYQMLRKGLMKIKVGIYIFNSLEDATGVGASPEKIIRRCLSENHRWAGWQLIDK